MAETGNLIQIAKILKSNGTDGELVMSFLTVDPEELNSTEPVFIYFDGLPVPFFIQSLVRRGSTKALVHLNDIESGEDAEEIVGQAVYVRESEDMELEEDDFSYLVGWTLYDCKGGSKRKSVLVGSVSDFIDIPANPCLELSTGAIIPLHEDLIIAVDERKQEIYMELPDGLL